MTMKVLFLSQQQLLRESFAAAFSYVADLVFLPPVNDVLEAIASILQNAPDVILVDVNPSLFGLQVARDLQDACPTCPIILLASHSDAITEAQLIVGGVKAVLSKNIGIDDLICAIRQVGAGKNVSTRVGIPHRAECAVPSPRLTTREAEVFERIAQGLPNKQIAANLGISIKTVEKHRQRVMRKLGAHETAGLTWRAVSMGVARASRLSMLS